MPELSISSKLYVCLCISPRNGGSHGGPKPEETASTTVHRRLTKVDSLAVLGVPVELEIVDTAVGDLVVVYLRS